MYEPLPFPSFELPDTLDDFFVKGRNLWPDLGELGDLKLDRSQVSDEMLRFLRGTSLMEYGVSQYVNGYLKFYGRDIKLSMWSAIWAAEEYVHYIVLRKCLQAVGEELSKEDLAGMEKGEFPESHAAYLDETLVDPAMDRRLQQLIFGVVQEYAAYVAYNDAAEACEEPTLRSILTRVARDEMRHCRFNQVAVESIAEQCGEEMRALIFPQFREVLRDFRMPQDHVQYFQDEGLSVSLPDNFGDTQNRSRMLIYLTHFFDPFRQPASTSA